jgi:hypothetical protein
LKPDGAGIVTGKNESLVAASMRSLKLIVLMAFPSFSRWPKDMTAS